MDVKGWCDIGYHYLISRDGRIWEGRPVRLLGSHSGGANTGNDGIAMMGSHDTTPITETQIDSLAILIRSVADAYGIGIDRSIIKGHRQYKSTSCPGDKLMAQLDGIVERARGGGPVQAPPDEPTDSPDPTASVTVQGVLYANDDPSTRIAGATISIGGRSTTTSSTGYWELDVAPGIYTVTATKSGYVSNSVTRSTESLDQWASFGLATANQATGTAILQGVVYYGNDGMNRIPYAQVTLSTGHTLTADGNGFYKVNNLPPGAITISAVASGYAKSSVSRTLANNVTEWGSVRLAP